MAKTRGCATCIYVDKEKLKQFKKDPYTLGWCTYAFRLEYSDGGLTCLKHTKINRKMCVNCKYAGDAFTSAYSGKTMRKCLKHGGSNFDYSACDDWVYYQEGAE